MFNKFLCIGSIIFFPHVFADFQIKDTQQLSKDTHYFIYTSKEFPLVAHVLQIPLVTIDLQLIPAIGQREEVSSIAKRSNAYIAINGSNYRRGGKYNGNRLNLLYLNHQIYNDLQFIRGSFGWNSKTKIAAIDTLSLSIQLIIDNKHMSVDGINQPRIEGKAILYNAKADLSLLSHTPGLNIVINEHMIIEDISQEISISIPNGWHVYQIDTHNMHNIQKGMKAQLSFDINSFACKQIYNDYDFVLGGAGLLMQNGTTVTEQLYVELSQGTEIVHCHDEIAADFHTKKVQEWLIEQRHPRTAIGINNTNEMFVVVVDGRQKNSEGLTLHELGQLMKQLGCINALNIGGGGCSTLWVDQKIVNNPSMQEERPVSEAICFLN